MASSGNECCGPEREEDALVGGGRLELEVEGPAEALAEGEAEGPVHARAQRRVEDELHPARLVEEALGDERPPGGERAQRGAGGGQVLDELPRAGLGQRALLRDPAERRLGLGEARLERPARSADTSSESARLRPGASPFQNGTPGGWPCASSTRTAIASTRRIAPGGVPEQEHVAGHALHREVLVHLADHGPSGSATTAYWAVSGMAPAPVRAAYRAPRAGPGPGRSRRPGAGARWRARPAARRPRPACPRRRPASRAGGRGRARRAAPARTARPRPPGGRPPRPRAAGRARRAGPAGHGWARACPAAARAPARRTRPARRGSWGRAGRRAWRRERGRRARPAAAPPRASPASRAAPPGPPPPRRCRARARRSPRWRGARRP